MTKAKGFTFLLIACVALVWGLIIYRIYAGLKDDEDVVMQTVSKKIPYFNMVDHRNDLYTLNLNYRNPFAELSAFDISVETKSETKEEPKSTLQQSNRAFVQKPQVNWSSIHYIGYVNNADSKQKAILVSLNGNTLLLEEGKSASGLKLLKNMGDSLKVQFQGEVKYIKIK